MSSIGIAGAGQQRADAFLTPNTRDPAFVDTYANQIRLSSTLTDMTLIFGVIEDIGPNAFINKDRAAIRLSPGTMKLLLVNVQAIVDAYERVMGEIQLPRAIPDRLSAVREEFARLLTQQLNAPAEGG